MLFALLSPAKKLDFAPLPPERTVKASQPALMKDTAVLAARARKLTKANITKLMDLSPKLAELNYQRFQSFDPANGGGTKPALFAFNGDVYLGLEAKTLTATDVAFAQKHIGIISGLYGLLRPLDAMQPYRLEMHSKLNTDRGDDLYDFWDETLTAHLNSVTAKLKNAVIINLASDEYWSAVNAKKLDAPVIQCVFKEIKDGKAKVISFMAKKARGMMARHIVTQRITKPEDLKGFDTAGYAFDAKGSKENQWVFSRQTK
jgi:cytoplasmic iron level regulating protein YaaA (DUF328/UPF0246 family)